MKKLILSVFVCSIAFISCQNDEVDENIQLEPDAIEGTNRNASALENFIKLYRNSQNQLNIVQNLKNSDVPIELSELIDDGIKSKKQVALAEIRSHIATLEGESKIDPVNTKIPEVWLFNGDKNFDPNEVLFIYNPDAKFDKTQKFVDAYDIDGKVIKLDAIKEPNVPVIIIDNSSNKAHEFKVKAVNEEFQRLGLQDVSSNLIAKKAGSPRTMITKMRLNNDQEYWFAGGAEIYALVTGVKKNNKTAEQVYMYHLPSVDHDGVTYKLNNRLIDWNLIGHDRANITFMEQDYGDVSAYIRTAKDLIKKRNARPKNEKDDSKINWFIQLIGDLITSIPDDFFNNDDDDVDVYYSIRKGSSSANLPGTHRNARIDLQYIPR